jgi:hypothetical protein
MRRREKIDWMKYRLNLQENTVLDSCDEASGVACCGDFVVNDDSLSMWKIFNIT